MCGCSETAMSGVQQADVLGFGQRRRLPKQLRRLTSRLAGEAPSMQWRMTGSDEGRLAQELGRVIGGALGTRVERQAF